MRKILWTFIFIMLLPFQTNAWWGEGHKTVAEIAYRHLTPKAKDSVDQLVQEFQKHDGRDHTYYYMSVWPDLLAVSGIRIFSTWHYIDIPYLVDNVENKHAVNHDNVLLAINEARHVVIKREIPKYERARFLSFLIHTVGDVHQPLHSIGRISFEHPHGDRGGNEFPIQFVTKHGTHVKNLHSLWDSVIGEMDQYFSSPKDIKKDADYIESKFPLESVEKEANDLNPQHWANESYGIGINNVYQLEEHSTPSGDYIKLNTPVAERRIALAGYRLANVLNQMFR